MRLIKIALAAAFLAAPSSVLAQQLPVEIASAVASGAEDDDAEDGNPRLGLLGLLGLMGLLGLIRPEPNIHIDARRPTRR